MNNHNTCSTGVAAATQTQVQPALKPLLKVAIDVHLLLYVAAIQEEGAHPKPPQRFKPADFLRWIDKQLARGVRIVTCYEAGPLGYVLHRQLTGRGVTNYVVRPRVWDEHRGRVKTDGRDALWMLNALDRFCAGNTKALGLVRVPTPEEERRRSHSRLRQSLARDRQMIAQRGRGMALQYGFRLKGDWFGRRNWPRWQQELPPWLMTLLQPLRATCLFLHDQLRAQDEMIEKSSTVALPKGMGRLTEQILQREAADWSRFKNRRQVSSYLGLCPSENSSGPRQQQGHITKSGNPRLRWALCELAWRLLRYQPNYRGVKKWRRRLGPRATPAQKKQALVALARTFGVDWWRLCTGRTTPEKLGLKMQPAVAAPAKS
jgi:transposase